MILDRNGYVEAAIRSALRELPKDRAEEIILVLRIADAQQEMGTQMEAAHRELTKLRQERVDGLERVQQTTPKSSE